MEKKKLVLVQQLKTGYGTRFGFHPGGKQWASASVGLLHIWDGFTLTSSHAVPGYEKGNIVFTQDGIVRIGLFEVDSKSGEKKYHKSIAENFAGGIAAGTAAHFSQYRVEEIFNFTDADLLVAATGYQPGKSAGANKSFSGPGNRLLLFERSSGKLLRVFAENEERLGYENLVATASNICYAVDGLTRIAPLLANNDTADYKNNLSHFVASDQFDNKYFAGVYNNRLVQFRSADSLSLLRQLPAEFEAVNGVSISSNGDFTFTAINRSIIQCWDAGNELHDSVMVNGAVEGLAAGRGELCMVAVAADEYRIDIYKQADKYNE
jgi:hypothetical protein